MTSTELATVSDGINAALMQGDLSRLSATEKREYYLATCRSLGLNPLTKPFEYLKLNGRELLYARKDATEQLRKIHSVSLTIIAREVIEGVYVVTAHAKMPWTSANGAYVERIDESTGAVPIEGVKGEARANAMMKAETKAKRRVTLSICGLGMLDESELESIPDARPAHDADTGEVWLPTQKALQGQAGALAEATSKQVTEMHLQRIASATSLEDLRQAGEAIKADGARIAKGDLAYLRASAKERKAQIASHRDTEPFPAPDRLKDAAL